MHRRPLPIVQSCPHAGLASPPELASLLVVGQRDLYNDADLWADLHFDFGNDDLDDLTPSTNGSGTLAVVTTPIARALVDVNRMADDLDDPDGAVKTMTSYGRPNLCRTTQPTEKTGTHRPLSWAVPCRIGGRFAQPSR